MKPSVLHFHLSNWIYFNHVKWNESVYVLIWYVTEHHSMYAVTDSVHVSIVQIYRPVSFDLKQCLQRTDSEFYPLYDIIAAFHLTHFCPVINCYVWKVEHRSMQYLHYLKMHCWGAEHRREKLLRKSPLELCSYRLCSNHLEENQFMHPDRRSLKNPKTNESSTNVNPLPFGSRSWLYNVPGMKKDSMLIPTQVSVDPYTRLP